MAEAQKSGEISDEAQYADAVRAMKSGDESAKTRVAYYKLSGRGGVEIDAEEAVVLLEERAKKDDSEAKWLLGLCCEFGIGTKQDIERAVLFYRQSSEAKNIVGEFLMKNDGSKRGSGVMNGRWSL